MKRTAISVAILFIGGIFFLAASSAISQPSWANFSYVDWNPGIDPALQGWDYQSRLYECRAAWDGLRFIAILSYEAEAPPADYYFAYSSDGRNWSVGNEAATINMPRTWSVGHHALACDPAGFSPTDVYWTAQSQNVKFKMWYCGYGNNANYRYAESTDGEYWQAAPEPDYCPPFYKKYDWNPTTRIMTKPSVLYRSSGESKLDTDNPMDNRYILYLGANSVDPTGGSGYFEMYISSNGLDWTIYAWDNQCQARWADYTSAPAEVLDFISFTGCSDSSLNQYPCSLQEVYNNGERRGYVLWTENYSYPIYSFYSTDGVKWICLEQPLSTIGSRNSGDSANWNYERNYNLDSVRLGESYFITRSGRQGGSYYNTGAAVVKGKMSAEVDTPDSPASGCIAISYKLYHWNAETCPSASFTFSTDGINFVSAAIGMGGDGTSDLLTGIGGSPHTYIWDSAFDLPAGASEVLFRVEPDPAPDQGSYGTTAPFAVEQSSAPSPTPTLVFPITSTPTPSPTAMPTPLPTHSPTVVPSVTVTPLLTPTPRPPAVVGDYDGDGTSDIAVFRSSLGLWLVRGMTRVWFGLSTDEVVPRDYSGDGTWNFAAYRATLGKWMVRGLTKCFYGVAADITVPGDYDGDGSADIALFRPGIGKWLVRGGLQAYYGFSTDTVVPGDYDGDGTTDIAVFRPSIGKWLVRNGVQVFYGVGTDTVVPGDYTGDGTQDFAVFRANTGRWLVKDGPSAYWGTAADTVQPADYDGDGTLDFAAFRSSVGRWLIRGVTSAYYGAASDVPVTNP